MMTSVLLLLVVLFASAAAPTAPPGPPDGAPGPPDGAPGPLDGAPPSGPLDGAPPSAAASDDRHTLLAWAFAWPPSALPPTWSLKNPIQTWDGVTASDGHNVTGLELSGVNMTTPWVLAGLPPYLETLYLHRNPSSPAPLLDFSSLPRSLKKLDLPLNRGFAGAVNFSGLPDTLEDLSVQGGLENTPDGYHGMLSGTVDWTSLPRSLISLNLDQNRFSGTVDWASLPRSLKRCHLTFNLLEGNVNTTALPRALVDLAVFNNDFTGDIDWAGFPPKIETIDIGWNRLSGTLNASAIPRDTNEIAASNNLFTGPIDWNALPSKLKKIRVDHNHFSGTFNTTKLRTSFTSLNVIDMSQNNFTGGVIIWRELPRFLTHFYASHSNFSGEVNFTTLTNLVILNIEHNSFSGQIDFRSLPPSCEKLYLQSNRFSGHVNMSSLPVKMTTVFLHQNDLSGRMTMPTSPQLSSLSELDVSLNRLSGTVDFTRLPPKLSRLLLSGNSFVGTINVSALPLPLVFLNVSNNNFTGPLDFRNVSRSLVLDITRNKFCGTFNFSSAMFLCAGATTGTCVGLAPDPIGRCEDGLLTCPACSPRNRSSIRERIEQISQSRQMVHQTSVGIVIVASALAEGGASLLQAGRTGLIVRLLACEANKMSSLSRSDHPTDVSVAVVGPEGSDAFAGSLVANGVIVASTWCVHGASVWLTIRRAANPEVNVAAQFYFPAHSIRMHMYFLQSIVTSSLFVLMNVSGTGWRVLALAILAAVIGIILGLMWHVLTHSTPRAVYEERDDNPMPLALAPRLLWHMTHKTGTWTSHTTYPGYDRQYAILFDDYTPGRHWYLLVELLTTSALAIVGCAPSENCGTLNSVATAIFLLNVLAMGALRPYHTRRDMLVSAICAFGNLLTMVLHAIGGWAHMDLGGSGLDTAADLVMLTVSIVAVAKAVCGAARLAREVIDPRKKPQMEVPLEMPLVGAGPPIKDNTLTAGQAVRRVEDVNALERPTVRAPPRLVIHDADL